MMICCGSAYTSKQSAGVYVEATDSFLLWKIILLIQCYLNSTSFIINLKRTRQGKTRLMGCLYLRFYAFMKTRRKSRNQHSRHRNDFDGPHTSNKCTYVITINSKNLLSCCWNGIWKWRINRIQEKLKNEETIVVKLIRTIMEQKHLISRIKKKLLWSSKKQPKEEAIHKSYASCKKRLFLGMRYVFYTLYLGAILRY